MTIVPPSSQISGQTTLVSLLGCEGIAILNTTLELQHKSLFQRTRREGDQSWVRGMSWCGSEQLSPTDISLHQQRGAGDWGGNGGSFLSLLQNNFLPSEARGPF